MAKQRPGQTKAPAKRLTLPPLDRVLSLSCASQIAVYQKAASYLAPLVRGESKRRGVLPPKVPELEEFIVAIRDHWQEQRRLCRENPDYFSWPTTAAWLGDGSFSALGLDEEGALKLFGYQVSREADLAEHERRPKLDVVFETVIPPFTYWPKVLEWGEPRTAARLKKMANCLAAFARNGSRQPGEWMSEPVEKWKQDLGYLRARYYRGVFNFDWPDVRN